MKGVLRCLSKLSDSMVWGSRPCWHVNRLMRTETYHDVDNEDSNVTERRTTRTQVGERLVTRCVNDQQTGDLVVLETILTISHTPNNR
jgi:hypothetical protein